MGQDGGGRNRVRARGMRVWGAGLRRGVGAGSGMETQQG